MDINDQVNEGNGNVGRILNDSCLAIKLDQSMDNSQVITQNQTLVGIEAVVNNLQHK